MADKQDNYWAKKDIAITMAQAYNLASAEELKDELIWSDIRKEDRTKQIYEQIRKLQDWAIANEYPNNVEIKEEEVKLVEPKVKLKFNLNK